MKTNFRLFTLFGFCMSLMFIACEKDEDIIPETPESPAAEQAPPAPNFAGADGSMWAVNNISTTEVLGMVVDTEIGIAVAAFNSDGNFNNLVDVGAVQVDGNTLQKQSNNAYTLLPGLTNPSGISYNNDVVWEVAGGSGFSAFNFTSQIDWPYAADITSGGTVSKSQGYTITCGEVNNADSVLFLIGGVMKTIPGNANSCNFTAGELSGLANGTNIVQVAAYASQPQNFDGKTVYIGKEAVRSKTVTIQD